MNLPTGIRALPDGRYVVQIEGGYTPSGGRRRPKKTADTLADAKKIRRDMLRAAAAGNLGVRSVTVKAWAGPWLERQQARLRPGTYKTYRSRVQNYIVPVIGRYQLDKLNPGHVRAVTQAARAAGYTSTTARGVQIILTKMLTDAIREGHAVPASVIATEKPRLAVHDRTAIPVADCLALLRAASERDDYARWLIAFLYGLREGEVLGLEWERIDGHAIDIGWQLQTVPWADRTAKVYRIPDGYEIRPQNGAQCLVRPKSEKGRRTLPMLPAVLEALPPRGTGLIFTRPGGKPMTVHEDSARWRAIQDAAGVRHPSGRYWHGHEIRHSSATLLMALGVPDDVRVAIMGHSSVAVTSAYSHADLTHKRTALDQAAAMLELG